VWVRVVLANGPALRHTAAIGVLSRGPMLA
jgi:hypothetical protein